MALQDALFRLNRMGLLDVLLPFALVFTIIYAISAVVPNIQNSPKFRQVISLIIGLMVVIPHITGDYPPGLDVVDIINAAIPQVAMVIVAVILVLLLIAATAPADKSEISIYYTWTRNVAMALVLFIFIDSIFITNGIGMISSLPFLSWFGDPDFQAVMLVILIFGLVVFWVVGGGSGQYVVRNKKGESTGKVFNTITEADKYVEDKDPDGKKGFRVDQI